VRHVSRFAVAASALAALALSPAARADANAELNEFLEKNAVASAYALMCDEEPMAEQLKANTMILLAVNGLPTHNVQLGSAKYNQVMKREVAATRNPKQIDCAVRVAEAKSRLAETQGILQATRRP